MAKFKGFSKAAICFLEQIKTHNNKPWFIQHSELYQQDILEVSRDLVEDLGHKLQLIAPGISIVPKVNGSIYRFARDIRFTHDKTPYKSHLSYLFWQGNLKRNQCPAFYLAIRPEYIQIGVGINQFTTEYLHAWREQCAHREKASQIHKIIEQLTQSSVVFQGQQLKRMPKNFSMDLLNQELIRYKGFKCYFQLPLPEQVYSQEFISFSMEYFQQLLALFEWMTMILTQFFLEGNDN
jgi:uncharacterized protein (TIGR02453 family)